MTYTLRSKKLKDIDPPAPTYEEDPTLELNVEKVKSSGSKGSYWETRLEIKKGDEIISQEVDHVVTYRGHAPVVLRNTSGSVMASESVPTESTIDPIQSSVAPEGAGDGFPQSQPESTVAGTSGTSGGGPGVMGSGGGNAGNAVGEAPGSNTTATQQTTESVPVTVGQPSATTAQPAPNPAEPPSQQGNVPPMVVPMPEN